VRQAERKNPRWQLEINRLKEELQRRLSVPQDEER